ncbi:hypothetical protein DFH07DRAFT_962892 [Mycena maculata]|uniref:Uncharacterized protein n=1 Tax=Mycena maculata TaxID=230809 RepID=A0AAD7IMX4_9AGAR|nr:hypothetical protein DFH07DRAFT_962892 [Mycena maculata]
MPDEQPADNRPSSFLRGFAPPPAAPAGPAALLPFSRPFDVSRADLAASSAARPAPTAPAFPRPLPAPAVSIPGGAAHTPAPPTLWIPFPQPPDVLPPPPRRQRIAPAAPSRPTTPPSTVVAVTGTKKLAKPRKPKAGNEIAYNELRPHVLALGRLRTWMSPFGIEHAAAFRKLMPEEVVNKTYTTLFASFAPKSHSNYAAGLLRFHQFSDSYKVPERERMPASHFLLAFHWHPWHDINGAPWEGENRWVELAHRTANKEGTAFKREQRGPVTLEHMWALRAVLDLSKPFDAAVWACATAAFWGCRRLGELTIPSAADFGPKYHITCGTPHKHITPSSLNPSSTTIVPLP